MVVDPDAVGEDAAGPDHDPASDPDARREACVGVDRDEMAPQSLGCVERAPCIAVGMLGDQCDRFGVEGRRGRARVEIAGQHVERARDDCTDVVAV